VCGSGSEGTGGFGLRSWEPATVLPRSYERTWISYELNSGQVKSSGSGRRPSLADVSEGGTLFGTRAVEGGGDSGILSSKSATAGSKAGTISGKPAAVQYIDRVELARTLPISSALFARRALTGECRVHEHASPTLSARVDISVSASRGGNTSAASWGSEGVCCHRLWRRCFAFSHGVASDFCYLDELNGSPEHCPPVIMYVSFFARGIGTSAAGSIFVDECLSCRFRHLLLNSEVSAQFLFGAVLISAGTGGKRWSLVHDLVYTPVVDGALRSLLFQRRSPCLLLFPEERWHVVGVFSVKGT